MTINMQEAQLRAAMSAALKRLLIDREITRNQLSKKIGVAASTVNKIFHGQQTPNAFILAKIADVLGVSLDELVGRTPPPKRKREPHRKCA